MLNDGHEVVAETCDGLDGDLAATDNVHRNGKVVESAPGDPNTQAIRALNAKLKHDSRVTISLLPLGDDLTRVRKR